MSGPINWFRSRLAPTVHAKKIAEGKLQNKNKDKVVHLGYKISQSKIGKTLDKVADSLLLLGRKVRSLPIKMRFVSPVEYEFLSAAKTGRAMNPDVLKSTDLKKSAEELGKLSANLEKLNMTEAREATLDEITKLTKVRQQRVEQYKRAVVGKNKETLRQDVAFAAMNPKMVRDYALHLLLYRGVKDTEGKQMNLPKVYQNLRRQEQQEVANKRSQLYDERNEIKRQIALSSEKQPQLQIRLNQIEGLLKSTKLDDVKVLGQAITEFQNHVINYLHHHENKMEERYNDAVSGENLLAPKPLLNWKASAGQDLYNMIYELQEDSSKLSVFMNQYSGELNLPSARYAGVEKVPQHVMDIMEKMAAEENRVIEEPVVLGSMTTPLFERSVSAEESTVAAEIPKAKTSGIQNKPSSAKVRRSKLRPMADGYDASKDIDGIGQANRDTE